MQLLECTYVSFYKVFAISNYSKPGKQKLKENKVLLGKKENKLFLLSNCISPQISKLFSAIEHFYSLNRLHFQVQNIKNDCFSLFFSIFKIIYSCFCAFILNFLLQNNHRSVTRGKHINDHTVRGRSGWETGLFKSSSLFASHVSLQPISSTSHLPPCGPPAAPPLPLMLLLKEETCKPITYYCPDFEAHPVIAQHPLVHQSSVCQ